MKIFRVDKPNETDVILPFIYHLLRLKNMRYEFPQYFSLKGLKIYEIL